MKTFRNSPIGLIDSGIGGLSLLKNLVKKYNNENYIYLADNLNMPYGNKSAKFLRNRILELVDYLYSTFNVKLVIIACNTASITTLDYVCKQSPIPVFGLDLNNLIKNADTTIICTKLSAKHYTNFNTYPSVTLARDIEDNIFDSFTLKRKVNRLITKANIDTKNVVLGCTHYELVQKEFNKALPDRKIILPSERFVEDFIISKPNISDTQGDILMLATLPTKSYIDKLWKIFKT